MRNTAELNYCFGCGVCAIACPKSIINIELDKNGFYRPCISNQENCIECGICKKVCSFIQNNISQKINVIESYGSWSKDMVVRRKCSSGGVGFEVGNWALKNGYDVVGVRYNIEKQRAEHFIASTKAQLVQTIGSKYIQSYTLNGFKEINLNKKYLVIGTPCQIDTFRRYIKMKKKEDNFILIDFFCHGVPSMLMWKKYCKMLEKKVGKILYVTWRDKHYGWHDSWNICVNGEKYSEGESENFVDDLLMKDKKCFVQSRRSQGDVFYELFLGDYCMNEACRRDCKYKYNKSAADIRIGDAWGKTYQANQDGVSSLIVFTEKGSQVVKELSESCFLEKLPFEVVAEGQMKSNCKKAIITPFIFSMLRSNIVPSKYVWWIIFKVEKVLKKLIINT